MSAGEPLPFEAMFQRIATAAPRVFMAETPPSHSNMLFVAARGELSTCVLVTEGLESFPRKEIAQRLVETFDGAAAWFVWVMEGWIVKTPHGEPLTMAPRLHPEREEILSCVGAHRDGRRLAKRWAILRLGSEVKLVERTDEDGVSPTSVWMEAALFGPR